MKEKALLANKMAEENRMVKDIARIHNNSINNNSLPGFVLGLYDLLPFITDLLKCNTDDIKIINEAGGCFGYRDKYNDKTLGHYGYKRGMPPIVFDRLTRLRYPLFFGLSHYESQVYPEIKYVRVGIENSQGHPVDYIFCKKGDLFKLQRAGLKLCSKGKTPTKPVLEPELLDKIVRNSLDFLSLKRKLKTFDVKATRGILLDGPPGNGKTMACRYIRDLCSQKGLSTDNITGSEIEACYKNNSLTSLFNRYSVLFFDDIDINIFNRQKCGELACAILTAMDGITEERSVVRIFTTNEEVGDFDAAFRRPGRIDCRFTFGKPDARLREELIRRWHGEVLQHLEIDFLVEKTEGFSFAELESFKTNFVVGFLTNGKWDIENSLIAVKYDAPPTHRMGF